MEAFTLAPGERALIGTGVAVAIPPGLCGLVLPRSGLAIKHGIACVNAPGLIDPNYRGEIGVILINHGSEPWSAQAGDRIAQLLITAVRRAGARRGGRAAGQRSWSGWVRLQRSVSTLGACRVRGGCV